MESLIKYFVIFFPLGSFRFSRAAPQLRDFFMQGDKKNHFLYFPHVVAVDRSPICHIFYALGASKIGTEKNKECARDVILGFVPREPLCETENCA